MTRLSHPYHMYDHIQESPEAFRKTARRVLSEGRDFVSEVTRRRRLYLAGIGTSHHAVLLARYLLRPLEAGRTIEAFHSFDFSLYPPPLGPDVCLWTVSHRGTKTYSVHATQLVKDRGGLTALITGNGSSQENTAFADAVFRTVPQEQSSAHTVSFFGAMGALSALALLTCRAAGETASFDERAITEAVPDALQAALSLEGEASALASRFIQVRRIWLVGAGPGAVTAREIALKIKETSYLPAEGMSVEEIMHGPFQSSSGDDLFVIVAAASRGLERLRAFGSQVEAIGGKRLVLTDQGGDWPDAPGLERMTVPRLPTPFSVLASQIPLLLFTYHLSLTRGTDPDGFRLEDPRFLEASKRADL